MARKAAAKKAAKQPRRARRPLATGSPHWRGRPQRELRAALAVAAKLRTQGTAANRRAATKVDPLLFTILYLPHHLVGPSTGGVVTLSEFHLKVVRVAVKLARQSVRQREDRDAFVAPREAGKSTWWYLAMPLWAAAHEHTRFTVAFADTATQAQDHLETLRHELETNTLLARDYPELCQPQLRPNTAVPIAQRKDMIHQANGWRMIVRGADKAALGLKQGADRPDLILMDDIEPQEANYSEHLMRKRRTTIIDTILALNLFARVIITGTVTMPGSVVHQLVKVELDQVPEDEAKEHEWVHEENFTTHYQPPIITDPDGTRRSWWPEKWTLDQLLAMAHTRSYRKNMENQPLAGDGDYWTGDEYVYGELAGYGRTILYIDPATTTGAKADWTGLAIISRSPAKGDRHPNTGKPRGRLWVRWSTHVRLVGQRLRNRVEAILAEWPDIGAIVVETNNGGEYLLENLADLGVPVIKDTAKESKEVRAERVLDYYQRLPESLVVHVGRQVTLEQEQQAFPTQGVHDDVMDAVNGGVLWLLRRRRKRAGSGSYV